jgi:hypothetical protein
MLARHAFWFCMGGLVILLLLTYALVVQPQAADAVTAKKQMEKRTADLRKWKNRKRPLYNRTWTSSVQAQKAALEKEKAACLALFKPMKVEAPLGAVTEPLAYIEEYRKQADALRLRAGQKIKLGSGAFDIRDFAGQMPLRSEMVPLAREMAIQKSLLEILIRSEVKKLTSVRFGDATSGTGAAKPHPIRRVDDLYDYFTVHLDLEIPHKLVNRFLQNVLDARPPFLIETITIIAAGYDRITIPAARRPAGNARRPVGLGRPLTERDIEMGLGGPDRGRGRPAPPTADSADMEAPTVKLGDKMARVQIRLGACDFTEAQAPESKN